MFCLGYMLHRVFVFVLFVNIRFVPVDSYDLSTSYFKRLWYVGSLENLVGQYIFGQF